MSKKPRTKKFDFIIIGGGFFGVSLALFLSRITKNILLIEKESSIMQRGSKNNQARVHTGFHYPRSAVTAVKSLILHKKFSNDFPEAIFDDFQMLYAIPKKHSKISSQRFWRTFSDMKAPIKKCKNPANLFNMDFIDEVFECSEFAFDYAALKRSLIKRLESSGIVLGLNMEAEKIIDGSDFGKVILNNGNSFDGDYIFNITYGNLNNLLLQSAKEELAIKNELVEVALIEPPTELTKFGITVMDGPFFSTMPFPANNCYTLTHVRHSIHDTWLPSRTNASGYDNLGDSHEISSKYNFMIRDASRFLPCMVDTRYIRSFYGIKSVLLRNEINDGRPILFHKDSSESKIFNVLGGKIDNIYDLFEIIKSYFPVYRNLNSLVIKGK